MAVGDSQNGWKNDLFSCALVGRKQGKAVFTYWNWVVKYRKLFEWEGKWRKCTNLTMYWVEKCLTEGCLRTVGQGAIKTRLFGGEKREQIQREAKEKMGKSTQSLKKRKGNGSSSKLQLFRTVYLLKKREHTASASRYYHWKLGSHWNATVMFTHRHFCLW